jgi:benzodiazapine receptor
MNPVPTPAHPNDAARQAAVVAALVTTVAVNGLANALPINGQTTGEVSARFPLLITPPGYVFAIWGPIYLGLTGYSAYQAMSHQRENPRLRKIGWLFVLSCLANCAWLLLWHYNRFRWTMVVMVMLLVLLLAIYTRLEHTAAAPWLEKLLVRLPFSIYTAWITVATLVNASVVLSNEGWNGMDLDPQVWAGILVSAGVTLGATIGVANRDPAYPLVLTWAFSGIAREQADTAILGPVATSAAGVTAALAAVAAFLPLIHRR